ncbi:MAG TPA: anthranilate synthase component I, partial [Polyangiaceae bacterium]|nr:anthranilate synthase component I [Polyangiaceae bacterium]
ALDSQRGMLLASTYDYPGRYKRWDMGFVNPPLVIEARQRQFRIAALNERGEQLLAELQATLAKLAAVESLERRGGDLHGTIAQPQGRFAEEERSKQPSVFSVLRALVQSFFHPSERYLGLYGSFGYDLAFQFEPLKLRMDRPERQRDLVLYLPDEIVVVDHQRATAVRYQYEFEAGGRATRGLARAGARVPFSGAATVEKACDTPPGGYAELVRVAHQSFKRGDLFEVVPGQTFFEPCAAAPSELFRRLRERNPSPYGFLANLGDAEYLVGASPEMYVRVEDGRVETCPISGTIVRGDDAISDAEQILTLLSSKKDEAELTMCTDVDRNDKSRICEPGSVRVIGRRQIEMYSRLIHTVDHVEGRLRPEFDGLDAFLAHAWAVTVTGAPKAWAMQFIEDHERSPRAWYGGAVGLIGFDGRLNTGLTLRTIRILDGVAQVRVGATLLYDSIPEAEEEETHTKAAALLDAIRHPRPVVSRAAQRVDRVGDGKTVLLVDHQDSFVHTLANYIRQTGARVVTLRAGFPEAELDSLRPDLVVLSPGPGTPTDFNVGGTLKSLVARGLPAFGVCLGLQGLVEYCGGELGVLDYPMHGKSSVIRVTGGRLFEGLPTEFRAGRYHSLYALKSKLPESLIASAESEDGVIMAVEHRSLPLSGVQFHPESILSLNGEIGHRILRNVLGSVCSRA